MTVGGLSKSVVYRATAAGELEVVYRAQSMQDVVKILQKEIQFGELRPSTFRPFYER